MSEQIEWIRQTKVKTGNVKTGNVKTLMSEFVTVPFLPLHQDTSKLIQTRIRTPYMYGKSEKIDLASQEIS